MHLMGLRQRAESCPPLAASSSPLHLEVSEAGTGGLHSDGPFCSLLRAVLWSCATRKLPVVQNPDQLTGNWINRDSVLCNQYFFFPFLGMKISEIEPGPRYCSYSTTAGLIEIT